MFSNLLFLIIVLLLAGSAQDQLVESPDLSGIDWSLGILGYLCVLGLITLQNRYVKNKLSSSKLISLASVELIAYLLWITFYLYLPAGLSIQYALPGVLLIVILYFLGLFTTYASLYSALNPGIRSLYNTSSGREYALIELRFLIPFVIPFLAFMTVLDVLALLPTELTEPEWLIQLPEEGRQLIYLFLSLTFFALVMILLPKAIVSLWQCKPIEDPELRKRLQTLCERAGFRHGGMLVWTTLSHAPTAAIIGFFPRYRYVMFTPRLLSISSPENLEAILAHEIGHSHYKHLLIYPLVILGGAILGGYLSYYLYPLFEMWTTDSQLLSILLFISFALFVGIYFRLVFGFFSRLFERQADLHAFALEVPVEQLIDSLDTIGFLSGNIHHQPNWHHYSIFQRMDFLQKAKENPGLILSHHRKVKRAIVLYAVFLALLIFLTYMR